MSPIMTPSPFSAVIGTDPDSSTFKNVESTQVSDTTSETAARPEDRGAESTVGVEYDANADTHVSGEDETAGQTDESGHNVSGT